MNKLRIFMIAAVLVLTSCAVNNGQSTKIRLNEVVHSIFYAPQYVAMEKGFFAEEGLEIELSVGQGADKSMTALLSDSADIVLLGTEAGIYVNKEGLEECPLIFAQLTERAGNFLVSRENEENFNYENLRGKEIIGGRPGGMPQMILEYVLKQKGIEPFVDVDIINNLQFTSTAGAFVGGVGEYTAEFDPSAYNIEKDGNGYVVSALGSECGKIPYTVYMSTPKYINENPEIIQKFTDAIYKAQKWVQENSSKDIANLIQKHFPENDLESLEFMIDRYKSIGAYKAEPSIEKEGFDLIQDIMISGGQLTEKVTYDTLVNNSFAEKAIKK